MNISQSSSSSKGKRPRSHSESDDESKKENKMDIDGGGGGSEEEEEHPSKPRSVFDPMFTWDDCQNTGDMTLVFTDCELVENYDPFHSGQKVDNILVDLANATMQIIPDATKSDAYSYDLVMAAVPASEDF